MIHYAYWDSSSVAPARQAELVMVWYRECIAAGHTPRLLTARDAAKASSFREVAKIRGGVPFWELPSHALRSRRGKILVQLQQYEDKL